MGDRTTFGNLKIRCRFQIMTVLYCSIRARHSEHTKADIIGIVKGNDALEVLSDVSEDKLEIISQDDTGMEKVLFVGTIECVELREEGQSTSLIIKAVSNTWKMDIEKRSRSFQDLTMSYRDVVEQVSEEYGAGILWNISDKLMEYPLIQYKETDYSFIKRILSHLGESIISVDSQEKVRFCTGVKSGNQIEKLDIRSKAHSLVWFKEKKQCGYRIENMDYARVGDVLSIQGRVYYVIEAETVFQHNSLNCTCLVAPEKCFKAERILANNLRGIVITGKVLKTEQELIKMHLDIDKEQDIAGAYNYPWKPITGNLFYCMPEAGSKAALYFGGSEEKNACVIYSIRTNGEFCEDIIDYNQRYYTTEHGKRMYLKPSEAGVSNMNNQHDTVALKDDFSVQVKSINQISVLAQGQIEMKGRSIRVSAPIEATLAKRDVMSPTVINLCNAFDAIGTTGNFTAIPKKKSNRRSMKTGRVVEKYSLGGAVENMLSSIPADDIDSPVMEAVVDSMPVVGYASSIR